MICWVWHKTLTSGNKQSFICFGMAGHDNTTTVPYTKTQTILSTAFTSNWIRVIDNRHIVGGISIWWIIFRARHAHTAIHNVQYALHSTGRSAQCAILPKWHGTHTLCRLCRRDGYSCPSHTRRVSHTGPSIYRRLYMRLDAAVLGHIPKTDCTLCTPEIVAKQSVRVRQAKVNQIHQK